MPDLLVKLYELQNDWGFQQDQESKGIFIRKPIGPEKQLLIEWVRTEFGDGWASEIDMALTNRPISCFIAIKEQDPVGFVCYDSTALGFFGPIGLSERYRGHGTGKALLMACLLDMKLKGYGYAIIGWAEPAEFYRKTVGAIEIPDSGTKPGVYKNMLSYPKRPLSENS
jgi:GNAT superfamily N-acetyltransferase